MARFVPSFAFALCGGSCFTASGHDSFTKSVVGHVARGEFEEAFVVECAVVVFCIYLPPIVVVDRPAIFGVLDS